MNFISYKQLNADIVRWSSQLPDDIVAVAGVPRSGIIPATMLALHRNIHAISLDSLIRGEELGTRPRRRIKKHRLEGRVLVLEDSVNTGKTLRSVRDKLPGKNLVFGSVYYSRPQAAVLDVAYREVPHPRCYEWMVFHCSYLPKSCVDLDGVLCEDPKQPEGDTGAGLQGWLDHMENAVVRYRPTYPIGAVVTSRLEKYREQTEQWLAKHGIRYKRLVMSPHATAAARRAAADHAARKAAMYAQSTGSPLFIESSHKQATQIARIAKKPVLCTDTMTLIPGR